MKIIGWTVVQEKAFEYCSTKNPTSTTFYARPKTEFGLSARPHIVDTKEKADNWANRFNQVYSRMDSRYAGKGYLDHKVVVKQIEITIQ